MKYFIGNASGNASRRGMLQAVFARAKQRAGFGAFGGARTRA